MVYALILAGGMGSRMNSETPKQYLPLGDYPVVAYTARAFERCALVDKIALVTAPEYTGAMQSSLKAYGITKLCGVYEGGTTRTASCSAGLFCLGCAPQDIVLIHDCARPFVSCELIERCIRAAEQHGAANPVLPCADALLFSEDGAIMQQPVSREHCYCMQTPQCFRYQGLAEAHRRFLHFYASASFADDCSLYAAMTGRPVALVQGAPENFKITTPADPALARALVAGGMQPGCAPKGEEPEQTVAIAALPQTQQPEQTV